METPYGYFGEDPYGWSEEPRSKARNVAVRPQLIDASDQPARVLSADKLAFLVQMGAMGNDYVRTRDRKSVLPISFGRGLHCRAPFFVLACGCRRSSTRNKG